MISIPPQWMYWTLPTVLFLAFIVGLLATLTLWDRRDPGYAREGLLSIPTTRGDRVFMGVLLTGVIFGLWLYFIPGTMTWGLLPIGALAIATTIRLF
jgi:predicted small integral membrane protein